MIPDLFWSLLSKRLACASPRAACADSMHGITKILFCQYDQLPARGIFHLLEGRGNEAILEPEKESRAFYDVKTVSYDVPIASGF